MIKFDVLNRFNDTVQFTAEIACNENEKHSVKLGLAAKWAIKTDVNLADVNLAGACLAGACLAGANLARANLARANLARAYLADAYLARANLADAYLAEAYLAGANLAGANLAGADKTKYDVPIIPKIDAVILAEIEKGGTLDMSTWHGLKGWCGTTHCRAGWAVHCAGKPGQKLEQQVGTQRAAAMIYHASRPGKSAPWFFATNEDALADIKACAGIPAANGREE